MNANPKESTRTMATPVTELTAANKRTLKVLVRLTKKHGVSPSLHEMAAACNKGVSTVRYHLLELDKKGYIVYAAGVDRGIEILKVSA